MDSWVGPGPPLPARMGRLRPLSVSGVLVDSLNHPQQSVVICQRDRP